MIGAQLLSVGSASDAMPLSERSAAMTPRIGRARVRRRNFLVSLPPARALNEPHRRHDPFEVARESLVGREWDERVAREVARQARIEAAFDSVDACERQGDIERALEWLDRAENLAGDLSPQYRARRERWAVSSPGTIPPPT